MRLSLLLLLSALGMSAFAQREDARQLANDNPLVGCWRYIDDGRVPTVLFAGDSTKYIWFGVNSAATVVARGYDSEKQTFIFTSSFVAYSDGKVIYGKVFKSSMRSAEGKECSFRFSYNKGKDMLMVLGDGKPYAFERINPTTQEKIRKKK